MGDRPFVSVVVPVRDRQDLLRDCLDGLGAQTYERFEVIVVDDGSTDGSGELAASHPCGGHPVRVVSRGGEGAVAARIAGVAKASGDVLAFTDSDCIPTPGWLEHLVAAIESGADLAQGRTEPTRPPRALERTVWAADDGLYATCNVAYRRQAYDRVGGFDADAAARLRFRLGRRAKGLGFGEDTILGWQVRRTGPSAYAEEAVVRHHVFPADPRDVVSRSLQIAAFPALVREVPELRRALLRGGVFLAPERAPLYAAAALLAMGRRKTAGAVAAVWILARWRRFNWEPSLRRRVLALASTCGVDVIEGASLIAGSASARTLVL